MSCIHWADVDSPVGSLKVASSAVGLAYIELPHASGRGFRGWVKSYAAESATRESLEPNRAAIEQLLEFLKGKRQRFDLPLDLRATEFQRSVYEQLQKIPYGESRSYGEIARSLGRPNAHRAVGAANGANPLPFVIPCHRVIASGGQLHGYAGGTALKARLLAMESSGPAPGRLL